MTRVLKIVGSTVLAFALWQAVVSLTGVPRFILPGPFAVLDTLWHSRALIAENAVVTFAEVIIGLVLGAMLGSLTAILMSASKWAREVSKPMLVFTQTIPVFALAPLLTLWLGYGLASKIAMALLIIYFPVTSAFLDALLRTPQAWIDNAKVLGGTPMRTLWYIRLPAALPGLASGLRLAAVYGPIGAIIGEWVGASKGLGYLMLLANGRAKTDLMFAALLVLAVFTILLHASVDQLARRLLDHYGDDKRA